MGFEAASYTALFDVGDPLRGSLYRHSRTSYYSDGYGVNVVPITRTDLVTY